MNDGSKFEGEFKNGKKNGMAYGYGLDGKLMEIAFYVDDEIYYSY